MKQFLGWTALFLGVVVSVVTLYFQGWLGPVPHQALFAAGTVVWALGALVTNKLDAVMTGEPSAKAHAAISLVVWPVVALLLLTTRHHVNNGSQNRWEF